MIEPRGFLVVDPLERHAGDVGTQYVMMQRSQARPGGDSQVVVRLAVCVFQINAVHIAVHISELGH